MRPGQLCPGNPTIIVEHSGPFLTASMRPGQLCPGNSSASGANPRKCGSFNEAGAIMPRKQVYVANAGESALSASMRPGQLCPGNVSFRGPLLFAFVLLQ